MANISKFLEGKWLSMLKGTAYSAPAAVYVGLIDDTADAAELEGDTPLASEIAGYTGNRKAITFGDISKSGTDPSEMKGPPATAIDFEDMPAPAGRQVKYAVICDADTSGDVLYWCLIVDALGNPITKAWNEGDVFSIPVEGLTVTLN